MKILLSIEHPAWVHQFRYVIRGLEEKGHTVKVVAIKKDLDLKLLDIFNIKYDVISNTAGKTFIDKGFIFLKTTWKIFWFCWKFKPDIFIGRPSPMMAINSFLFRKKHIVFEDTENSHFCAALAKLFSDVIFTPTCFKKNLGRKQYRIDAYKELFYLHPDYFTPDPNVLSELGLAPEEKYAILRFSAWESHHDRGLKGLSLHEKCRLVAELEKYARVFISSESPLSGEFEKYSLTTPLGEIHNLLYYAALFISDGATMATESAVLGTPTIRISPYVGPDDMGNFCELEDKYELIYNYRGLEQAIQKILELFHRNDTRQEWRKKREKMLAEKINATQFMVDFIDNYPVNFDNFKGQDKR